MPTTRITSRCSSEKYFFPVGSSSGVTEASRKPARRPKYEIIVAAANCKNETESILPESLPLLLGYFLDSSQVALLACERCLKPGLHNLLSLLGCCPVPGKAKDVRGVVLTRVPG